MTGGVPQKIRAVTFDLWQTLILDRPELGEKRGRLRVDGAAAALRKAGFRFSEGHLWAAYRSCATLCNAIRAQERDISFSEQVELFIEQIRRGLARELPPEVVDEVAAVYDRAFLRFPPALDPDAPGVLAALKERGLALGLISNTGMTPGSTFRAYMGEAGILEPFDVLVFSNEARRAKPSMDIFRLALDALGAAPGASVHVGDDPTNDVAGAKAAGMRAIWIPRPEGSYGEFDRYGAPRAAKPDATVEGLAQVVEAVEALDGGP